MKKIKKTMEWIFEQRRYTPWAFLTAYLVATMTALVLNNEIALSSAIMVVLLFWMIEAFYYLTVKGKAKTLTHEFAHLFEKNKLIFAQDTTYSGKTDVEAWFCADCLKVSKINCRNNHITFTAVLLSVGRMQASEEFKRGLRHCAAKDCQNENCKNPDPNHANVYLYTPPRYGTH